MAKFNDIKTTYFMCFSMCVCMSVCVIANLKGSKKKAQECDLVEESWCKLPSKNSIAQSRNSQCEFSLLL